MADIDVRRRGPGPLWWVLGLLAIAGVAWWVVAVVHRTGRAEATSRPARAAAPASRSVGAPGPPAEGPLGSVAAVVLVPDRLALLGRRVDLHRVAVQTVVGDGELWVGPGVDERLFVVMTGAGPGAAGPAGLRTGRLVDVHGVVERVPRPLDAAGAPWTVPTADTTALREARIYVAADSVALLR